MISWQDTKGGKVLTCVKCDTSDWYVALDVAEQPVMICNGCQTATQMAHVMPPLCDGCGERPVSALNKDNPAPSELWCQTCIDDAEEELKMAGVL